MLALLFAAEGVSNLLISLALVRSYGLVGVAAGTLIPAILFQGLLQPVCVCKSLQISLTSYCREVLLRPALVLGALVLVVSLMGAVESSGDWSSLAGGASILLAVTVCLVFFLGLTKTERNLLVRRHVTEEDTTTHDVTVHSRLESVSLAAALSRRIRICLHCYRHPW